MRSCGAGTSPEPISRRAAALYSVSTTSVDLPPPETPVTQVKVPSGNSAVSVLQIVAARADDAARTRSFCMGRRIGGTSMRRRPDR